MRIRRARKEDYPLIIDVLAAANMHHIPSKEMPALDLRTCYVALSGRKIVGIGAYKMLSRTRGKTLLLAVMPEFRGRGIGRALQERRIGAMRRRGARSVITNADRPEAIAWYLRMGYRKIGTLKKRHEFGERRIGSWTTLELILSS